MYKRIHSEHIWWLGIVLWSAAILFWAPRPIPSYLDAPSASPRPAGFAIFHDLLASETKGTRRLLDKPSELPFEVGVLVVLSPSKAVPLEHRKKMLDWVTETGGTLIIGHPIKNELNNPSDLFIGESDGILCPLRSSENTRLALIDFVVDANTSSHREVPTFGHEIKRVIDTQQCNGVILAMDEINEVVATVEEYGDGTVIQLSQADLLDNEALGWKQTHLFAAALIDLADTSSVWAFDEAHEGILPKPKFIELIGASRYRSVFLQVLLLVLLAYWWRTTRLGQPQTLPSRSGIREVATKARDTGDFYMRAGKSRWALSCSLEYLKLSAKERGASGEVKKEALALIETAKKKLKQDKDDMEKHAQLIRKIVRCQHTLLTSRGKTK